MVSFYSTKGYVYVNCFVFLLLKQYYFTSKVDPSEKDIGLNDDKPRSVINNTTWPI